MMECNRLGDYCSVENVHVLCLVVWSCSSRGISKPRVGIKPIGPIVPPELELSTLGCCNTQKNKLHVLRPALKKTLSIYLISCVNQLNHSVLCMSFFNVGFYALNVDPYFVSMYPDIRITTFLCFFTYLVSLF